MKNIGFDMDGVILDHSPTVVALLAAKGLSVQHKNTSFAQLSQFIGEAEMNEIFDRMYQHEEGTKESLLMQGACESLDQLRSEGHGLFLLSRRNVPYIAKATLERLRLWPRIFNENNSYFVQHSSDKREIASRLDLTHYVDDQPTALHYAMSSVRNKYLFDQYDSLSDSEVYARVTDWRELLKLLQE